MIGCSGRITYAVGYFGANAKCTCGWTDTAPNRAKIRKAAITHAYGTKAEREAAITESLPNRG
jgi:hypothetical protein